MCEVVNVCVTVQVKVCIQAIKKTSLPPAKFCVLPEPIQCSESAISLPFLCIVCIYEAPRQCHLRSFVHSELWSVRHLAPHTLFVCRVSEGISLQPFVCD